MPCVRIIILKHVQIQKWKKLQILKRYFPIPSRNNQIRMRRIFDYNCKLITEHPERHNRIEEFVFLECITARKLLYYFNKSKCDMTPLHTTSLSNLFYNRKSVPVIGFSMPSRNTQRVFVPLQFIESTNIQENIMQDTPWITAASVQYEITSNNKCAAIKIQEVEG